MEKELLEIQEAAKKALSEKAEEIQKNLKNEFSAEQKTAFETMQTEMIAQIEKATSEESIKGIVEKATEGLTKQVQDLEEALKVQGEKMNKAEKDSGNVNVFKEFSKENYEKAIKDKQEGDKGELFSFETKAFADSNVLTVDPVGTAPNQTTSVNTLYRTLRSKIIGFFSPKKPIAKIMDLVSIHPLEDSDTLVVFNEDVVGDVEITPECEEKPVITYSMEDQSKSAEPIAGIWYTTLKIRRFFAALLNKFRTKVEELIDEKIPNYVFKEVMTNASGFTPAPGLDVFVDPGKYEAIVSVAASLKKRGYTPNVLFLSPIDYALMITEKGSDGHYKLQNGQSISILGSTMKLGNYDLEIIEQPTMNTGDFLVGDLENAVHVGLDDRVYYFETDGRTDAESGSKPKTGLAVNIRTHEVAQFIAVIIPDAAKAGIVKTTFNEVLELIAADTTEG